MDNDLKTSEAGDTHDFLSEARVEGKYTPSAKELLEIMSKLDVKGKLAEAKYKGRDEHEIKIGFNSLEESHLFTLSLFAKGILDERIAMGPSDFFFEKTPLQDCRVDPFLCVDEEMEGDKLVARIYLRNTELIDSEGKDKYSNWVRTSVEETMPHLSENVKNFQFQ